MLSEKLTQPSRQWLLVALTVGLAVAVALSMVLADEAEAKKKKKKRAKLVPVSIVLSDTGAQSGFDGLLAPNPAPLNAQGDPFTFAGASQVARLDELSITLTLFDGDTELGETEENELTLGLDGIDTGLRLNGFRNNLTDTKTITDVPNNAPEILTKLKEDGKLDATLIDRDTSGQMNVNALRAPSAADTTLTIRGIQFVRVRR